MKKKEHSCLQQYVLQKNKVAELTIKAKKPHTIAETLFKLTYLSEIFVHLDELNRKCMKGMEIFLTNMHKIQGLVNKLKCKYREFKMGCLRYFSLYGYLLMVIKWHGLMEFQGT